MMAERGMCRGCAKDGSGSGGGGGDRFMATVRAAKVRGTSQGPRRRRAATRAWSRSSARPALRLQGCPRASQAADAARPASSPTGDIAAGGLGVSEEQLRRLLEQVLDDKMDKLIACARIAKAPRIAGRHASTVSAAAASSAVAPGTTPLPSLAPCGAAPSPIRTGTGLLPGPSDTADGSPALVHSSLSPPSLSTGPPDGDLIARNLLRARMAKQEAAIRASSGQASSLLEQAAATHEADVAAAAVAQHLAEISPVEHASILVAVAPGQPQRRAPDEEVGGIVEHY